MSAVTLTRGGEFRAPFWNRVWTVLLWSLVWLFILNVAAVAASVAVDSLGTRWFGTWLPEGFTTKWYFSAWDEFQLGDVLIVTAKVVASVVFVSVVLGVPAAYALARRDFAGKRTILLLLVLPVLVPTITYGVPLATLLYRVNLGGTIWGVICANLVPTVPFVVLVMTPFIEQIDQRLESAARVCGAGTWAVFRHVLVPLLAPGIMAASLLVLVRSIGMFELTFLTAGPDSQTLVVSLYAAAFSAGIRANQSLDALAVVYMVSSLFWLIIALRFVNPVQLVARVKD